MIVRFDYFDIDKKEHAIYVFNSEVSKWLPKDVNYNRNYKPDGFISYTSFAESKG